MADQESEPPTAPEGEKEVEQAPPGPEKGESVYTSEKSGEGGDEEAAPKEGSPSKNFLGIPGAAMPAMPKISLDKKEPEAEPPNALWSHIEARDWDEVPEDLEGEDAVVAAKEWHKQNLPLHAVCKSGKAPDDVVIKLIDIYPDATKKRGKNRMFPLQLAINNKCSYNVVRKLIRMYPEALDAHLSDDGIRKETTRTWIDLQAVSADVKKLVHRTTADWKVIIEYEDEQHEQHDKLISLEKKLKTAKKKQDATDLANKTLAERVEHLESVHSNMQDFVNEIVGEKKRELDESMEELRQLVAAFSETQSAKNKELQDEIDATKRREIEGRAVFNGFTEDLMTLYQQNSKATEDIKKRVSENSTSASEAAEE